MIEPSHGCLTPARKCAGWVGSTPVAARSIGLVHSCAGKWSAFQTSHGRPVGLMNTCGSIAPRGEHTVGAVVVSTNGPYGVVACAREMHIVVPGRPATWTAYARTKLCAAIRVTDGAHGPWLGRTRPSG